MNGACQGEQKPIKLHLGCGKRDFGTDWIHIDAQYGYPHVKYHDVTKLPFTSNSVDLIYASHLLEYFDREEGEEVLREWYRVLMSGGILRLAVPNFLMIVVLYHSYDEPVESFLGPLYGKIQINGKAVYHKTAYDYGSLSVILEKAGFVNIHKYDWRKTEHAGHDDHSQSYIPHMDKEHGMLISLNVEGVKP